MADWPGDPSSARAPRAAGGISSRCGEPVLQVLKLIGASRGQEPSDSLDGPRRSTSQSSGLRGRWPGGNSSRRASMGCAAGRRLRERPPLPGLLAGPGSSPLISARSRCAAEKRLGVGSAHAPSPLAMYGRTRRRHPGHPSQDRSKGIVSHIHLRTRASPCVITCHGLRQSPAIHSAPPGARPGRDRSLTAGHRRRAVAPSAAPPLLTARRRKG